MIKANISVRATFDVQRLKLCCMHWYFLGIVTDGIESRALRWLFFAARYTRLFMQTFRSAESKAENLLSWFEIWVGKTRISAVVDCLLEIWIWNLISLRS